jgi:hypothetical protein
MLRLRLVGKIRTGQESHSSGANEVVCEYPEKKPQVPPLRFAPVGMTILLCPQKVSGKYVTPQQNCHPDRSEA